MRVTTLVYTVLYYSLHIKNIGRYIDISLFLLPNIGISPKNPYRSGSTLKVQVWKKTTYFEVTNSVLSEVQWSHLPFSMWPVTVYQPSVLDSLQLQKYSQPGIPLQGLKKKHDVKFPCHIVKQKSLFQLTKM